MAATMMEVDAIPPAAPTPTRLAGWAAALVGALGGGQAGGWPQAPYEAVERVPPAGPAPLAAAVRAVKNAVIGNRSRKVALARAGAVPLLVGLLRADAGDTVDDDVRLHAVIALGSFSLGTPHGARSRRSLRSVPSLTPVARASIGDDEVATEVVAAGASAELLRLLVGPSRPLSEAAGRALKHLLVTAKDARLGTLQVRRPARHPRHPRTLMFMCACIKTPVHANIHVPTDSRIHAPAHAKTDPCWRVCTAVAAAARLMWPGRMGRMHTCRRWWSGWTWWSMGQQSLRWWRRW
jgi:hypothetical protein